jgi:transcription antitermination factor NusG
VNPKMLPWYALQVRTRYERMVSELLAEKGYETFLPFSRTTRQWSDRQKKVSTPLFPGYLFCRFNVRERAPIINTPGMIQIVGYRHMPVPLDDKEIEAIQAVVDSGLPIAPCSSLEAGDSVVIKSGPLAGLEGILTEFRGRHRLILSIKLLQRSIAVEVNPAIVEPHSSQNAPIRDAGSRMAELQCAG